MWAVPTEIDGTVCLAQSNVEFVVQKRVQGA